jgi:tetratricopeptide (TPR) repeat protein
MRRFIFHFAVLYATAFSLCGQSQKFAQLQALSHAEDSLDSFANNQIFYNNARGLEPTYSEPAGTVSVEQLQHPLSRKANRLLLQAKNFAAMGDHAKAIAELQLALKEPSAIPYAHSLLGSEYLKIQQVPEAIEALEQAVKMLPRSVVNHSNLAYALLLTGDAQRAEIEARQALDLDRNNAKTRQVLSLITHAREAGQ